MACSSQRLTSFFVFRCGRRSFCSPNCTCGRSLSKNSAADGGETSETICRHRTDPGLIIKVSYLKLMKSFKKKKTKHDFCFSKTGLAVLWCSVCPSVRRSGVGGSVRSCGPKTTTMVKEGGWDGDGLRPQHHWWIQTFSPFLFFFFFSFLCLARVAVGRVGGSMLYLWAKWDWQVHEELTSAPSVLSEYFYLFSHFLLNPGNGFLRQALFLQEDTSSSIRRSYRVWMQLGLFWLLLSAHSSNSKCVISR